MINSDKKFNIKKIRKISEKKNKEREREKKKI